MTDATATHWIILFAILLPGCAQFQSRPLAPGRVVAELEARQLDDPALKTFLEKNLGRSMDAWPVVKWDGKLLTLVALYYHPDMDMARAKWGTARAALGAAGERPNPTVSISPGYNTNTFSPSPWLGTANIDIPIETANKRGYRIAQAQHNIVAARANLFGTAWQVRSRVERSALDYIGINQTAELLRQQQASQEQIVRLLELQQPNGNVLPTLVTQARIALRGIRLSALEAQRQRAEVKAQLADALGLTIAAIGDIELDQTLAAEMAPVVPSVDARREALTGRSDVLAALADYAASQAALQLEIAKQYPDVHLGPGYEFDQGDNKYFLGLGLTLPIFNQNQGAIAEAQARRVEAAVRFTALQAKVIGEVDRAVLVYEAARQKFEAARELTIDVQTQRKATQAAFDAGDISKLELIGVQLELQTNEQASLEATLKAHQALLAIEDAMQRPLGVAERALTEWPRSPFPSPEKQTR